MNINFCISQYRMMKKISNVNVLSDDEEYFEMLKDKDANLFLCGNLKSKNKKIVSFQNFDQCSNVKIGFCISSNQHFLIEASRYRNIEFIFDTVSEICYVNRCGLTEDLKKKYSTKIINSIPKIKDSVESNGNKFVGVNKSATFVIVDFNTSKLTNVLIQSIYKNVKSFYYNIVIFDNSNKQKFKLDKEIAKTGIDIKIYDNTEQQLIKFGPLIRKYVIDKEIGKKNGYGSFKHTVTIDYILTKIPEVKDNVILCDSDIILKKDIDFIDETKISVGSVIPISQGNINRIAPFLQYVNNKMLKEKEIRYFDPKTAYGCSSILPYTDTGYSLLKEIIDGEFSFTNIDISKYCVHLGSASFNDKHTGMADKFIEQNKNYWDNSILFFTSADRKYEKFIIPYIYFARKFNPFSKFEIIVNDSQDKIDEINENVGKLKKKLDCEILIRKPKISNVSTATMRFVEEPETKCEYTYCGDIDIMILEKISDFHVRQMEIYGTDFDNIVRYNNTMHLSGLHFVKTDPYYRLTEKARKQTMTVSDEVNLMKICADSKLKFKPKTIGLIDFKLSRPDHGFHVSMNRRPFNANSDMSIDCELEHFRTLLELVNKKQYVEFSKKSFDPEFNSIIENGIEFINSNKFNGFDILSTEFPKSNKKCAIYTCQIGNYDNIQHGTVYDTKNFDYFYFTDNPNIDVDDAWKVVNVSNFEDIFPISVRDDNVRKARFIKTHPHLFFKNYDRSIWIDANLSFIQDPKAFIDAIDKNCVFTSVKHPSRNCIYKEALEIIKLRKDKKSLVDAEMYCISHNLYPENNGLIESGVMVRNHNDQRCISLMNKWWIMIENYSRRDQLSFNYICWKNGFVYDEIQHKDRCEVIKLTHHKK